MNLISISALLLIYLVPVAGYAQLAGHNTRGDFGLQLGTQAPPGFYVVPLFYDYRAETLRDTSGDHFAPLGDLLTLEDGLSKSFMGGAVNVGIAYYAQWKISDDDLGLGFTLPVSQPFDRHRVYGIRPEVTIPLASKGIESSRTQSPTNTRTI